MGDEGREWGQGMGNEGGDEGVGWGDGMEREGVGMWDVVVAGTDEVRSCGLDSGCDGMSRGM